MWHKYIIHLIVWAGMALGIGVHSPHVAYNQEIARFLPDEYALIFAEDSPIYLWDGPMGKTMADVIRVGALVQIDQVAGGDVDHPYLIHSVTEHHRRGWVSGEVLTPVANVRNHIGNVVTCSQSVRHAPVCGAVIPLSEADALMFHFDYVGVERGDYLQWVIVMDGEQYSSRPIQFLRPQGAMVLNMLDIDTLPHRFTGEWRIVLYINNKIVHERTMTILPRNAFPPLETDTVWRQ